MGEHAKGWNIANSATPIVWTIEEAEGGYVLRNSAGLLGFDAIIAGSKGFRDKGTAHHPVLNIMEFDYVEPLTFEFVDNADGSITVIPSDDKAEYFFDIFSDEINARQGYANDREGFDFDIAYCVTAPEIEVHTGTTTVDPTDWVNYWFGGAMAVNPGEYRLLVAGINPGYTSINSDVFSHTFQVVGRDVIAETWENIHALLAEADEIFAANQVTITYDSDGYFADFTSPVVGKVGYKKHDVVWAVCDGVDYVKAFTDYFENAAEAEEYMADFGGIASLEDVLKNVIADYKAAAVALPEAGKTYIIRNYPYTYGNDFSYAYYFNGEKLALSECANATTAEYMWTCEGPVEYTYFDNDLNVLSDTRYQFTNALDSKQYLAWRGAGSDNYAGVSTDATQANTKWYLTDKKVDGSATPAYGTLALRTYADNNQYRTAVVDMRKSTDHLSKSNGDHFDATYSSWFIFEEVEVPVTEWDGQAPAVEVVDDVTAKVIFNDAHSVEATNYGVLAAVFDEQGDAYALAFNDLFPETVSFEGGTAVLNFKKVSEINAQLAEAAKGLASKVTAAVGGSTAGKIVIASKSFKVDGEYIYNETIIADFNINNGTLTNIETIALDSNVKVYDFQGRRVVLPAKGLFIQDGKKVVK